MLHRFVAGLPAQLAFFCWCRSCRFFTRGPSCGQYWVGPWLQDCRASLNSSSRKA
jgi:hypothetical protein